MQLCRIHTCDSELSILRLDQWSVNIVHHTPVSSSVSISNTSEHQLTCYLYQTVGITHTNNRLYTGHLISLFTLSNLLSLSSTSSVNDLLVHVQTALAKQKELEAQAGVVESNGSATLMQHSSAATTYCAYTQYQWLSFCKYQYVHPAQHSSKIMFTHASTCIQKVMVVVMLCTLTYCPTCTARGRALNHVKPVPEDVFMWILRSTKLTLVRASVLREVAQEGVHPSGYAPESYI